MPLLEQQLFSYLYAKKLPSKTIVYNNLESVAQGREL